MLSPLVTGSPTAFIREDEDIDIFAPTKAQNNFYMILGRILHDII